MLCQREGGDYNEIFSPLIKYTSIKWILALVTMYDQELEQLDVKQLFSMKIWKSKFLCINLRDSKNMTMRIWCANWRNYYMVWNNLLANSIEGLILLWFSLGILSLSMIAVFILEYLEICHIFIYYCILIIFWLLLRVWFKWINSSLSCQ